MEVRAPGSAPLLCADLEAAAKSGGLSAIRKMQAQGSNLYSVSAIGPEKGVLAMNHMGQTLDIALFKGLHELPRPLRTPDMLLRGIEAFLVNLLYQQFTKPDQILDVLCEQVHRALDDLVAKQH